MDSLEGLSSGRVGMMAATFIDTIEVYYGARLYNDRDRVVSFTLGSPAFGGSCRATE